MWNRALVEGLRQGQRVVLLLPLYVCLLVLGVAQTWPLGLAALNGGLRTPFLDTLVTGGSDALADLFISVPNIAPSAGIWTLLFVPFLLLFSLAYNFFSGGMLSVSAGTRPFWAGCRYTFWSFTALGIVLVVLVTIGTAVIVALGVWLGFGTTTTAALIFALSVVLNLCGEYARAIAIVRNRLNPFVLFGTSIAFCVRHGGGVLAMCVLGLLLQVAVIALYVFADRTIGPSILAIALQQVCVIAWLWAKFIRLLWALFYVRANDQQVHPAFPEAPYTTLDNVQIIP